MKGLSEVNVLLVDDREDGLVALQAVLSPLGYNLVLANSGAAALAKVLETDFAVIVLDVQMPEMDGFETASLIKSRDRSRHIPILFVTAINKDPRFVYRGYEVGAVDYLFKPFDPQILRAKVDVFVDLHLKNQKLKMQSDRIRAEEAKNRVLLESARDAIALLSAKGEILSLSDAFVSMTGWPKESWVGKKLSELLEGVTDEEGICGGIELQDGELCEVRLKTQTGELLDVEISTKAMVDEAQMGCHVVVLRDITQRKEAEAVKRRAQELERSNRELDQFASVCSHDLQEPLRVISNFVPLLDRRYGDKLDEEGRRILSYIEKSSKRMSDLVRDLLRYSRLGAQNAIREVMDGEQPLEEAIQNLQVALQESGGKVVYGKLPPVTGSRTQIVQLFQNLIGNAIKFHGEAPPVIEVDAKDGGLHYRFSVRDNGIGIDGKYAGRIFDIFRRLHSQDEYPGTGVGLAICKKVVDRHGGKIWVESEPGCGSTFFFTLPKPMTGGWASGSANAASRGIPPA